MTVNRLIYDVSTFEVELIPQMIDRGYQVASRLLRQKGLIQSGHRQTNQRLLFRGVNQVETFPAKGSAYFAELLANQIKDKLEENNGKICRLSNSSTAHVK